MFLQNQNTWYTMKSASVKVEGEVYKPNNVFDYCKFLERIELPSGRKLRFAREWVLNTETGKRKYCKIKLQDDLTVQELKYISDLRNIKTISMRKSKSLVDKFFNKLFN